MICYLSALLLTCCFTILALAAPLEHFALQTRNASVSSPAFNTTVRSPNGTDVSSSFRTMIYYQSDTDRRVSNLTDRQVTSVRRIDTCRQAGADFQASYCKHSQGSEINLRQYTIYCTIQQIPMYNLFAPFESMEAPPNGPRILAEHGSCGEHEICVNSMPHQRGIHPMATCVNTNTFMETPHDSESIQQGAQGQGTSNGHYIGDALRGFGARKTGIVFSQQDASTVIELDSLEVDVGVQRSRGGKIQQQTCKDCFGLRTKTAVMDANFMKIEATLMSTAVTAGLIWVTVFAG